MAKKGWDFITPKYKTVDTWDEQAARKLANALIAHKKKIRISSKWPESFQQLRLLDKKSKDEITKVLDWFTKHMDDEYTPIVHSAKTFRAKFQSLKVQQEKSMDTQISQMATQIADPLRGKGWPGGLDQLLDSISQKSLDAYTKFWEKANQWLKSIPTLGEKSNNQHARLMDYLLEVQVLASPFHFVQWWLELMHTEIMRRESWAGDARFTVWSLKHPTFERVILGFTYTFCRNSDRWRMLLAEIDKQESAGP